MIRVWCAGRSACDQLVDPATWTLPPDAIWIDLVAPTVEEETAVEKALGLSVPTREEMAELEASSRVYRENGATYATADIIIHGDEEIPGVEPVTFVVTDGPLVTIRYTDPRPFRLMIEKLEREPGRCATGPDLFLNLMETIIDRLSDILSGTVLRVETIAGHVFSGGKTVGFGKLITKLGRAQMTNARIEQSLAGLARIFAFVGIDERMDSEEARAHLRSLARDADSLSAHNQSVAASINFQLSAALGLINIEQSSIIKIFSVAAVAFLPPTLIASIYGMNFDHMPELSQPWGYPLAVVAMVVSAILPLAWFRKQGWL
ncbi:magnesium transporter CorA family protein [Brevundimonas sp. Root1423]|uniref:magnesium transporter CorA family protein n=1 Tax=Brevundimonas sp. Root1423 TaxID=1736462 RepID=UPI0006F57895|nr:magnesium transporter CorA family protein [Brevundimonas sp. Root1423]KQY89747.1 magnesium transporter [Brevundimonas sp. Root1423]